MIPNKLNKQSYTRMTCGLDTARLREELARIPDDTWKGTLWSRFHCSVSTLLLRGGDSGGEEDYASAQVRDQALLSNLPYLKNLISENGPFGEVRCAFLFAMKPDGLARVHVDFEESWQSTFRVHIPILTHEGALALSECRSLHMEPGFAWTFNNQALHAAVNNSNRPRVHLILDVVPNAKLDELLSKATIFRGELDVQNWRRCLHNYDPNVALPFSVSGLSQSEKREMGLAPNGFASKITQVADADVQHPLAYGSVVTAVNGVQSHALAYSIADYVEMTCKVGDVIRLQLKNGSVYTETCVKICAAALPMQYPPEFTSVPSQP